MSRAQQGGVVLFLLVIGILCVGYALGPKVAAGVFGGVLLYVALR